MKILHARSSNSRVWALNLFAAAAALIFLLLWVNAGTMFSSPYLYSVAAVSQRKIVNLVQLWCYNSIRLCPKWCLSEFIDASIRWIDRKRRIKNIALCANGCALQTYDVYNKSKRQASNWRNFCLQHLREKLLFLRKGVFFLFLWVVDKKIRLL